MLRLYSLATILVLGVSLSLSACKKHSEPVKSDPSGSASTAVETQKAAAVEEPTFKIAEQSRKTLNDAKQLEEEIKKAAESQRQAMEAQEKAINEAK